MPIIVHPSKSQTEDQTLGLDGGSHPTQKKIRQEMKTILERELGAYFGGEFRGKKGHMQMSK